MRGLQILLVLFTATIVADIATATSPKPKPCPNGCGFAALCRNKKCVCRPGRAGNPNFACFSPKFYNFCQIASDPMITDFSNQTQGIKMPAALSLTNLTTRRFGKGRGKCMFILSGWSQRFDGKYFIKALQFKLTQKKTVGPEFGAQFRVVGKAMNNQYFWTIWEKKPAGWVKIEEITPKSRRPVVKSIFGCNIRFMRLRSKFLYVNVMCCTVRFAIRPFNPDKPALIPGIWVMVRKWAQMDSLPEGLCNSFKNAPDIDTLKNVYGFSSRTQYTTYVGLRYGRPLVYPGAFPGLAALQTTLKACNNNKVGAFMTKSEFLFNFAKLIACEKDKMMGITFNIVKGFCNNDAAACAAAISTMQTDCPNVKPNKQMKAFLTNGCL